MKEPQKEATNSPPQREPSGPASSDRPKHHPADNLTHAGPGVGTWPRGLCEKAHSDPGALCQWRSLIANMPLVIAILDRQYRIQYLNRSETGAPPETLIGKSLYDFVAPAWQEAVRQRVERVFATGESETYEVRAVREDGQEHWYQGFYGPIFEDDQVQGVSVAVVNVTANKTAELECARAKAVLMAAIDSLPFAFFALGTDNRYFLQNPASRQRFGEAIGKRPEDMAPDEATLRLWRQSNEMAFAGQRVETEMEVSFPAGQTRHFLNVVTPIRDGENLYGILGVNIDITDRKLAEETLKKSNDVLETKIRERTAALLEANESLRESCDELEAIYDGMLDGLVIADAITHQLVHVNRAMYQRLGYDETEYRQLAVQQRHPAQDLARFVQNLDEAAAGRLTRLENVPLLHKDGSIVYFDLAFQRIFYKQRSCVVILHHDVTQARLARAALESQQQSLEHMLQASDHERQLIAYDIHDGLAQYLAGAIMQLEAYSYLKDSDPKEGAEAYRAGLAMLRQSHAETRRLISGVRPPILDESGVIAAISHMVNEQRPGKGPQIEVRSRVRFKRLPPILENAIYRIVQEALTNACKHSQSRRVRISLVQEGDRLRIQVRDWGLGFDASVIRENRFGLAGIRERARLLGGSFQIKSKPGKGSLLIVELPVVERKTAE